ncbi:MAG: type II toxin-antitoxin system Phd/YefM family antitoxin [Proteobacteria bacterium]|nr:type II toxin-antitoxin system Phd/YefM family antitoxin [Pseudomonadota bacterium]
MLTINIHEAKTHLSRFIEKAAAGEEIIIAKAGTIAKLVPLHSLPSARSLGIFNGKLNVPEDFDAALPEEMALQFQSGTIEPSSGNR